MRRSTLHSTLAATIALATALVACGGSDVGSGGTLGLPGVDATTTAPPSAGDTTTTSGGSESSTTTTAPGAPTTEPPADTTEVFVDVYLIDGVSAAPVTRAVEAPSVAANAIRALIAGPTDVDEGSGLSSEVPTDTLLLGLDIDDDGLATVDLSREFEVGGGSFSMFGRLAQVVYTLTQFPTVDRVAFRLDGEPVTTFSGEGIVFDGPVDNDDYLGFLPIGHQDGGGEAATWDQGDLPPIAGVPDTELGRVVLVADDDTLNVRTGAGVDNPVIGEIVPGAVVHRLGETEVVGSSVWAEIATPTGTGWVNATYLGAVVGATAFAADDRVAVLLDDFAAAIAADGDIRPMVSARGLYVAHHADPIHFTRSELDGILTDPTTYKWPSAALDESDPAQLAEIPSRTFAEAITDRWLDVYDDPDRVLTFNQPVSGGNGRLPEFAIPYELGGFNYAGLYDPGDDPQYGGLDWNTWYVSVDYEDGKPRIVALTVDEWSP
jgi:spore germination protein GerM